MISYLHLFWIIPLTIFSTIAALAIAKAGSSYTKCNDCWYREDIENGSQMD